MDNKKIKTSNIVLIVIAIMLIIFTTVMIYCFLKIGSCPDILITSVFAACLGELGFLSHIKTTKQKYRDDAPYEDEEEE